MRHPRPPPSLPSPPAPSFFPRSGKSDLVSKVTVCLLSWAASFGRKGREKFRGAEGQAFSWPLPASAANTQATRRRSTRKGERERERERPGTSISVGALARKKRRSKRPSRRKKPRRRRRRRRRRPRPRSHRQDVHKSVKFHPPPLSSLPSSSFSVVSSKMLDVPGISYTRNLGLRNTAPLASPPHLLN